MTPTEDIVQPTNMDTFAAMYPESAKLRDIMPQSQLCKDFYDYIQRQGIRLAEVYRDDTGRDRIGFARVTIDTLLAGFFEIDMDKVEAEKRAAVAKIHTARGGESTVDGA